MAKKVNEVIISRFEYTVIKETFYLEVVPGKDTLRGKVLDYYFVYLQRGTWGAKRFIYGCPKVDQTTGEILSVEQVAEQTESFLLQSIVDYMEDEEAANRYHLEKEED